MLLIETEVKNSATQGLGLFALHWVAKGQKYWVRNEEFDRVFTPQGMNAMNELTTGYIKRYGFLEANGNWYLCGDNAKFSNHSKSPNSRSHYDDSGLVKFNTALTDIQAGEEILCDYTEICKTCIDGVDFVKSLR